MLKKILRIIFAAFVFLLMFGVLSYVGLMIYFYYNPPFAGKTYTNVAEYSSLVKSKCNGAFMYDFLLENFPAEIPNYATDVKMYYHRAGLRGDYNFQLRLKLPEEDFKKELAKFSGKEIRKFIGGNTRDHQDADHGAPTTFFHTGDDDKETFSDDYVILLLGIRPPIEDIRRYNYDNCGIAYNEKTNTIVYWANNCCD